MRDTALFLCYPSMLLTYAADGKTVGLIAVVLWVDEATVEEQVPSVRRRASTNRPEVAVRALEHRRARRLSDEASIRKREWELVLIYYYAWRTENPSFL